MARKAKQSQNRITNTTTPEDLQDDDIPVRLCHVISWQPRQPSAPRGANHGGLIKSWKLFPKSCNSIEKSSSLPQFSQDSKNIDSYKNSFFNYWYHRIGGGYNEFSNRGTNNPFMHMVLSNHPENLVAIGVTGVSRPLFMFYKQTCPWSTRHRLGRWRHEYRHDPDAHKWVKYNYTLIDPNSTSQKYMQLVNIVGLNGKYYALSLQGTLVVIEEVDLSMIITMVSSSRAAPSVFSRHFREYLVESDGEIWLIFLLSLGSTSVVDKVEIFWLQMESITWKKVEKFGKDRALFVGASRCLMVTASEVGCKANCVYITNREVDGWWVYDVARGDISPSSNYSMLFDLRATLWKSTKVV